LEHPIELSAESLWDDVSARLRGALNDKTFRNWFSDVGAVGVDDDTFVLAVPNDFTREWIEGHFVELIRAAVKDATGAERRLRLTVRQAQPTPPPTVLPPPLPRPDPGGINPKYTFDSFVIGSSNRFAHAAALAVAEAPAQAYNPLFIYGGTGLGKTHLLHAVGKKISESSPVARVVYLSSEEFTNEFVESVRDHKMPDFRRKFREECDVLLIDDIQFLGRKEETQKEFFYTFNTLHERSKAIVLTSDTVPSEIPGLEERLRSRFTMGLITDIQEPNFETRVAILKKKGEAEGFSLPDRVCQFIARHVHRNVRELEGALIKISAMHSLTGQPITEEFAAQVLKDILPQNRPVDLEQIQREVARFYKIAVEELRQDRRTKHLAHARSVAMYLCRKLTKSSFPEIANRFNKDHSTVISAVRKVEKLREEEPSVKRELLELESKLGGS
jgi:chromosomal replication initiator protein